MTSKKPKSGKKNGYSEHKYGKKLDIFVGRSTSRQSSVSTAASSSFGPRDSLDSEVSIRGSVVAEHFYKKRLQYSRASLAEENPIESDPDSITPQSIESPLMEVYEVKILLSNISTLINWCVDVGLLMNGHGCSKCGSEMRWKVMDKKVYWNCITGKHQSCRISAKIPFSYEGMTINKMVRLLFMWYDQQPSRIIRRFLPMNTEDFGRFDHTICEVCVWACEKLSEKIGGDGVRVNVEIGRRLGLLDQDQLVIGGTEGFNYRKLFYAPFAEFNTTLSQWTELSTEWIFPGSVVYTYSDGIHFMKELGWKHSDERTLKFNTGCLAEDLFRQTLSVSEYPFKEFARHVGGYFANVDNRFPPGKAY